MERLCPAHATSHLWHRKFVCFVSFLFYQVFVTSRFPAEWYLIVINHWFKICRHSRNLESSQLEVLTCWSLFETHIPWPKVRRWKHGAEGAQEVLCVSQWLGFSQLATKYAKNFIRDLKELFKYIITFNRFTWEIICYSDIYTWGNLQRSSDISLMNITNL